MGCIAIPDTAVTAALEEEEEADDDDKNGHCVVFTLAIRVMSFV